MNFCQCFDYSALLVAALLERKFTCVFQGELYSFLGLRFLSKKFFFIERKISSFIRMSATFLSPKTGETEKMGVEITNRKSVVWYFVNEDWLKD